MVATRSTSRSRSSSSVSPPSSTSAPTSPKTVEMTTTLSRSSESVIPVGDGVIRVRPYRSSSTSQLKAVLSFTPRVSALDRHNEKSQVDEFRGFFVLFWIGMALLFIRTSLQSWTENRTLLSWSFGRLITGDVVVLAFADGLMTASMFLCVPFVKALQHGWFKYYWVGVVIQHLFQTTYLAVAILWGYHRQWYWVQSGFLVLHCLANLMKMHSYMAHNGMLSYVSRVLSREEAELNRLLSELPGGRQAVLAEAAQRHEELLAQEARSDGPTPVGTPGAVTPALVDSRRSSLASTPGGANGHSSAMRDPLDEAGDALRRRSLTHGSLTTTPSKRRPHPLATDSLPQPNPNLPIGTSLEPSHATSPHSPPPISPLAWSSNPRVAILARNIDAMRDELKSHGAKGLVWPANVTFAHFTDYIFLPTLVYELEYPRTNSRNFLVVLEKIAATFGTFSLIYLITEHYIMPYTPKPGESLARSFANLALPMMINYLLIFYIIFECVCTGFAELSYFADREFYQDWWNSTSMDQFSRKWNKPVHTFLLRHVYASTMDSLRISRTSATFITFLLSALVHELVMAVVTKKIRPYLFLLQMAQIPLIALGRLPAVRKRKVIGNIIFWVGLMMGFPLLAICYLVW